MADDLSSDTLSTGDKSTVNLGIEESAHRVRTQQSVFQAVLSFSAVMFMTGIFLALVMTYLIAHNPALHWHSSILVAAMVVPPTVMMIALLRAVYRSERDKDEKDEKSALPVQDLAREVARAVREGFKPSP